jgi:hypothetical protein
LIPVPVTVVGKSTAVRFRESASGGVGQVVHMVISVVPFINNALQRTTIARLQHFLQQAAGSRCNAGDSWYAKVQAANLFNLAILFIESIYI